MSQSTKVDSLKKLILITTKKDKDLLKQYTNLCEAFNEVASFDSTLKYSQIALSIANEIGDVESQILFNNKTGVAYWNKSQYDDAIRYYEIGLKLCLKSNQINNYSTLYNNIGLAYWDKADLPKALNYFIKARKIDKQLNDKKSIAISDLNIGLVYADMGDYNNALSNYFNSVKLNHELGDEQSKALAYINIGQVYSLKKEYLKSMEYNLKALRIAEKYKDNRNLAFVYNNIGSLYSANGEYDKAIEYFYKGLEKYTLIGEKSGQTLTLNNIGDALCTKLKFNDAVVTFNKALKIEEENDLIDDESTTRRGLANAYYGLGNFKLAYENYLKHIQLSDSVKALQNVSELNNMQKAMELKQKETELNLQKEKELAIKEAEKQKQTYVTIGIIIILALTVIFSFFLYKRFKLTNSQKEIIEKQKHLVEEKQKEIVDSITYAKRIQNTLLANKEMMDVNLPENFVLFKPKDIVSGDFYWITESNKNFYLAVCDSTGHGVPGAFMSLLNIGFLSEAINEKDILNPNEVFNYTRKRLVSSISKDGQQDGFDGILLRFNSESRKYSYTAANNSPVIVSNGILTELAADKMPVGKGERNESFAMHEINAQKGDMLYLYTDGFADQFGGPKGKKFKYKQLNDLLLTNASKPLREQHQILEEAFEKWKGELEQVDDVCIIGIRL